MTQPNPSPNSFMQQDEKKASKTRSPRRRRRSPSGRMSRWPCKDYLKGTCNNSFCEKWHPPECLFYKTKSGCRFGEKCSHAHRQVETAQQKVQEESKLFAVTHVTSTTDLLCATHQIHDNWVSPFRIWSRRSFRQFYGRAQTCRNRSDV